MKTCTQGFFSARNHYFQALKAVNPEVFGPWVALENVEVIEGEELRFTGVDVKGRAVEHVGENYVVRAFEKMMG